MHTSIPIQNIKKWNLYSHFSEHTCSIHGLLRETFSPSLFIADSLIAKLNGETGFCGIKGAGRNTE
jgi:hypothetical protein